MNFEYIIKELHVNLIYYKFSYYLYRQYVPVKMTITIDFSCLDQSVYDIVHPYDTSLCVEEK